MVRPVVEEVYVYLGARLRRARLKRCRTLAQVAFVLGTTVDHVSKIERGIQRVNIHTLLLICRYLNVDPADMIASVLRDSPDFH